LGNTYARILVERFQKATPEKKPKENKASIVDKDDANTNDEPIDNLKWLQDLAVNAIKNDAGIIQRLRAEGVPWGGLNRIIADALPDTLEDKANFAFSCVPIALNEIFGKSSWDTFKNENTGKKWVHVK